MINKKEKKDEIYIHDLNPEQWQSLGFNKSNLETEHHIVTYFYYDIGRLVIQGKKKHTSDNVYIEDYFTVKQLLDIIAVITGHEFTPQQYNIAKIEITT